MASYPSGGTVQHYTQGTEFYSHDEAKVLAETYYNIGNEIYINHCFPNSKRKYLLKKISGVYTLRLLICHFPVK